MHLSTQARPPVQPVLPGLTATLQVFEQIFCQLSFSLCVKFTLLIETHTVDRQLEL